MSLRFKLLIKNPQLETSDYSILNSNYLTKTLGCDLYLPNTNHKPFILSCFALSIDGKICYPDLMSGFAIAKNNFLAAQDERYADWWNLLLGRSISDAIIIGSNTLSLENYTYTAEINIPELTLLRKNLGKTESLLHIVITRDSNKIDFEKELLCQNNNLPLLIYTEQLPNIIPNNFHCASIENIDLTKTKQLIHCSKINLTELSKYLYQNDIKTILNESPYYHHQLQELKLLDEAWINTSGVFIGGNVSQLGQFNNAFDSNNHPHYTILTLHSLGYNFIYTRYKINYS